MKDKKDEGKVLDTIKIDSMGYLLLDLQSKNVTPDDQNTNPTK